MPTNRRCICVCTIVVFCLSISSAGASANEPKPELLAAFEHYRALTETRMETDRAAGRFLYFEKFLDAQRAEADATLHRGDFYFEQLHTLDEGRRIAAPGGMIHHWIGIAYLPGATLAQTKAVLEDYANQKVSYFPDVRQSRLVSQNGDERNVFLQFYSKTLITTVFNVNFSSVTRDHGTTQTQIRACSTRVAEVDGFGTPQEHELRPEDSHGYLWALCTWWHVQESGSGTYIQVEAIELSRGVPWVYAWLVDPIIRNVPKTFLAHLLDETRKAVNKGVAEQSGKK